MVAYVSITDVSYSRDTMNPRCLLDACRFLLDACSMPGCHCQGLAVSFGRFGVSFGRMSTYSMTLPDANVIHCQGLAIHCLSASALRLMLSAGSESSASARDSCSCDWADVPECRTLTDVTGRISVSVVGAGSLVMG